MNTPDLTKAQLLVLARTIIGVLVAFGVSLTTGQQTALLALVGVLGSTTLLADAIIRHGRARTLSPGLQLVNSPARRTADPITTPTAAATPTSPVVAAAPAMPAPAPAAAVPVVQPGVPAAAAAPAAVPTA